MDLVQDLLSAAESVYLFWKDKSLLSKLIIVAVRLECFCKVKNWVGCYDKLKRAAVELWGTSSGNLKGWSSQELTDQGGHLEPLFCFPKHLFASCHRANTLDQERSVSTHDLKLFTVFGSYWRGMIAQWEKIGFACRRFLVQALLFPIRKDHVAENTEKSTLL